MASILPLCPKCDSLYVYVDDPNLICPECGHEWDPLSTVNEDMPLQVKDANGNLLADGDYVTLIKDLKIKGTSSTVKIGTRAKINRIVEGDHDLDSKVDGIGVIMLKSQFVKKA